MNQDYRKRMEEREIDLLDLIYYVSMHWRSILVAALVGMAALGVFSAVTAQKSVQKAKLATIESMQKDLMKEYEEDGTYDTQQKREDRLALVETVAEQIKAYDVVIDAQNQYLNGSVFARENVTNLHCRNLQYLITVDGNKMTYLDGLADAYKGVIQSDAVYAKVADKTGREVEKEFASECIVIDKILEDRLSKNTEAKSTSVNVYSVTGEDATSSDEELQNGAAIILNVLVMGPSDEFADAVAKAVTEAVEGSSASINESITAHTIANVGDNAFTKYSNEFATKKSDAVGAIKARRDDKAKLVTNLTETEASYMNMIVDEIRIKENEEEPQQKVGISKKMIALGFIGGAAVLFVIWAAAYVLCGKLAGASVVEGISDTRTYSIKVSADKKFIFDKWFATWFDKTKYLSMDTIASLVALDIKKNNVGKVAVIGISATDTASSLADAVRSQLQGGEIIACPDVSNNPEMREAMMSADAVVVVEDVTKARVTDFYQELLDSEEKKLVACVCVR